MNTQEESAPICPDCGRPVNMGNSRNFEECHAAECGDDDGQCELSAKIRRLEKERDEIRVERNWLKRDRKTVLKMLNDAARVAYFDGYDYETELWRIFASHLDRFKDAAKIQADRLRAEVERLKGERDEARKNLGPEAFGESGGVYNICLGYHPETNEYEWLRVVPESKLVQRDEALGVAIETIEEMDRIHDDIMTNGPRCTCGDGDEWCKRCGKSQKLSSLAHAALRRINESTKS